MGAPRVSITKLLGLSVGHTEAQKYLSSNHCTPQVLFPKINQTRDSAYPNLGSLLLSQEEKIVFSLFFFFPGWGWRGGRGGGLRFSPRV